MSTPRESRIAKVVLRSAPGGSAAMFMNLPVSAWAGIPASTAGRTRDTGVPGALCQPLTLHSGSSK